MPKANGSIHYVEHRSPMKDKTGEYLIHPQFVYSDVYDFQDMTKDETMLALSQGMEVKVGNMLVIRPKLKLKEHKDEKGNAYHKVYHEGDLVCSDETRLHRLHQCFQHRHLLWVFLVKFVIVDNGEFHDFSLCVSLLVKREVIGVVVLQLLG